MTILNAEDPLAVAAVRAVRRGDVDGLRQLLSAHLGQAAARIGDHGPGAKSRTLLHVVTDWPGHFPSGAASVAALVQAGADVNARFRGQLGETPLHWAASSDDVEVLDALLYADTDIDAPGSVIAGGTPLDDATAFAPWKAARRLVERGARVNLFAAASLGLLDQLAALVRGISPGDADQVSDVFWGACHGGQLRAAEYLLDHGAVLNWLPGWEPLTPLDAAARGTATDVVTWLHSQGAKTCSELRGEEPGCTALVGQGSAAG